MDFGRLPSVDAVDFRLPDDDPRTAEALALSPLGDLAVRVGTPRWADRGFVGKLYPKGTPNDAFLQHYARHFSTIELNSTYYGVQEQSLQKWRDAVGPAFRFCTKFPAAISHEHRLRHCEAEVDQFLAQTEVFGATRGPSWILPPTDFGPRDLPLLARFLQHIGDRGPVAVELRHADWFHGGARDEVFGLLQQHGAIAMLTDVAGRRDVLHMALTSPTVMIRFVGNRLHASDFARTESWTERLVAWRNQGMRELYLFLHQPEEHLNVEVAEHWIPRLSRALGTEIPLPRRVPTQQSLF